MGNRQCELLDEVNQLLTQYRQEVPGGRRAWPESIKARVLELRRLGLNYSEIAKRTGVPYFTVLRWRDEKKAPSFEPLAVVPSRASLPKVVTVTVPKSRSPRSRPSLATVTVAVPGGIRIEGVSLDFLLRLLPRLKDGAR